MICDLNCFNCIYDDCINSKISTKTEIEEIKKILRVENIYKITESKIKLNIKIMQKNTIKKIKLKSKTILKNIMLKIKIL